MEQMEQIQDEARGGREEELGAKGVFHFLFHLFHLRRRLQTAHTTPIVDHTIPHVTSSPFQPHSFRP